LISIAVLFSAFAANEVLGASRFVRDTSAQGQANASGSGSSQSNSANVGLVINITATLPTYNVSEATQAAIQRVNQLLNSTSSDLRSRLDNAVANTADAVNNTAAVLQQVRDGLTDTANATVAQLRDDLTQIQTAVVANANQVRQLVANQVTQAAQTIQQQIAQLQTQVQAAQQNVTTAYNNARTIVQKGVLLVQQALLSDVQALLNRASQSSAALVTGLKGAVAGLQAAQNALGSVVLAPLISSINNLSISASGSASVSG